MATIIKGAAILGDDTSNTGDVPVYTIDTRDEDIERYWGELEEEKRFPIAFWKLRRLFNASTTDEVALRITDINNDEYIEGRWIVFDGNYEDDINDDPNDNIYYFVLDKSFFIGSIEVSDSDTRDGLFDSAEFPFRSIIWGRIGLQNDSITYTAYFDVADAPTIDTGGTGGGGATGGAKIPAN